MKKLSCILLAVMLITALFVSCTAEVIDPYDGLAYVTFGGPASKDLSASYEVQSYEDLYWFYTARKDDGFGKTGETEVETPLAVENNVHVKGLGGKIGPFSQGTWNFVLKAYNATDENKTLVYEGSANGIKLTKSEVKSVPVSVTPQGDYGTIEFRNASFKWAGTSGEGKPTIKITAVGPQTYTLRSDLTADKPENRTFVLNVGNNINGILSLDQKYRYVSAGYYNCKVVAWVVDESSPIFEQSFGIRVYGSAATVISGDITEKVDSFVDFEVGQEDLVVFKGASTMEVLSTPSNASDKVTTVDFGSNLDGNKTYSLSVKSTTAAEAASKFTVSDGEASVAGIDLTLTTDNTPVISFDSEITITTYITAGLDKDSVKVLYGNEGKNYLTDYDSTTGKLVFKTNHFSEYYVVSNAVASIGSTGYAFLQDAINKAQDGETICLLNDIDLKNQGINVNEKSLTINGNGKQVTYSGDRAAFEMAGDKYKICFLNVSIYSVKGGIWDFGTNGTLEIQNSNIIGDNYWALYHNGSTGGFKCKAVDSSFTSATTAGIYISGSTTTSAAAGRNQKLDLEGCTVTGSTGIEGKYTDMTLTNCTVTALAEAPVFEQYNNGTTTDGFAVVSTDNSMRPDSPKPTAKIIISGGTYKGLIGLASLVNTSQYPDFTEAEYIYENNPSVNN